MINAGDVYAAGLAVGRILHDAGADPEVTARVCAVIRKLEDLARSS